MSELYRKLLLSAFVLVIGSAVPCAMADDHEESQANQQLMAGVDNALGMQGQQMPGGVLRFNYLRTDLTVQKNGVTILPALALDGYAAFVSAGDNKVLAVAEVPLLESEVQPFVSAMENGGSKTSAIHNHLLEESPRMPSQCRLRSYCRA